jgi:TatD DNase family protein
MFIDSHAHLDSPEYLNDLDVVIQRARDACVQRVLVVGSGMDRDGLGGAVRMARRYKHAGCFDRHPSS